MSRAAATLVATGCDVTGKKVLMVGAGGIGCELVKNLVLMGFEDITMIDLDKIDYSNLNRQFLFRAKHVERSKAEVAAEAVLEFPHDPNLKIEPRCGNIKETQYDMDFFKSFDIVLNGLDNVEARKHVNRCCLAAGTPLIESGTQGYLGQVRCIIKGTTQCYECEAPPPKKTYPVCTIRNHPDKPVHCIHWARELLFGKLFGGEETDLIDASEDGPAAPTRDNAEGPESPPGTPPEGAKPAQPIALVRSEDEAASAFAARVFGSVFEADVERLLRMADLWKERAPPTPLRLGEMDVPDSAGLSETEQRVWTIAENASVFLATTTRVLEHRSAEVGSMRFDKDDEDALDFVTAAANLRCAIFGIPLQSKWEAKEIAGNIIPAIATTNAIIAGFIVLEALKVISGRLSECRYCVCNRAPAGRKQDLLLAGTKLDLPKKECYVCGKAERSLTLDTTTCTVGFLIDVVCKKALSFNKPTIDATNFDGASDQLAEGFECEDDDPEDVAKYARYREIPLSKLPVPMGDGGSLKIGDESQGDLEVTLRLHHAVLDPTETPDGFVLEAAAPMPAGSSEGGGAGPSAGSKRSLDFDASEGGGGGNPGKRPATDAATSTDDDVVLLE